MRKAVRASSVIRMSRVEYPLSVRTSSWVCRNTSLSKGPSEVATFICYRLLSECSLQQLMLRRHRLPLKDLDHGMGDALRFIDGVASYPLPIRRLTQPGQSRQFIGRQLGQMPLAHFQCRNAREFLVTAVMHRVGDFIVGKLASQLLFHRADEGKARQMTVEIQTHAAASPTTFHGRKQQPLFGPCPLQAPSLQRLLDRLSELSDLLRGHGLQHPQRFVLILTVNFNLTLFENSL